MSNGIDKVKTELDIESQKIAQFEKEKADVDEKLTNARRKADSLSAIVEEDRVKNQEQEKFEADRAWFKEQIKTYERKVDDKNVLNTLNKALKRIEDLEAQAKQDAEIIRKITDGAKAKK